MPRTISVDQVHAMLADGTEIAFLDMREISPTMPATRSWRSPSRSAGSSCCLPAWIPRRSTRIVLTDDRDGDVTAETAAGRLARHGYTGIALLDGGVPAWGAAGHDLHPEYEVVAKPFGPFARRHGKPAEIGPRELAAAHAAGED